MFLQVINREVAAKKSADVGVLRGRNLLYDFLAERLRDYVFGITEIIQAHCEGLDVADITPGIIEGYLGKGNPYQGWDSPKSKLLYWY